MSDGRGSNFYFAEHLSSLHKSEETYIVHRSILKNAFAATTEIETPNYKTRARKQLAQDG